MAMPAAGEMPVAYWLKCIVHKLADSIPLAGAFWPEPADWAPSNTCMYELIDCDDLDRLLTMDQPKSDGVE
jgi:hypothetical protein